MRSASGRWPGAGDHHAGHRPAGTAVRGRSRSRGPISRAWADRRGRERPAKASLWHFTQSFPTFLALSLYQIESNTRSAAVLGFVGAGGIGLIYAENMRLWNWDVVMFITLLLVAVVMIMDTLSARLRRRYIGGAAVPLYQGGR